MKLHSLRGTALMLVFYPFAFSRVCTDELDDLQRELGRLSSRVRILAVSVDHKYALRTYAEQRGYEFDLLADFWPHGEVAERYGVLDRDAGYARRATFFIDADGLLRSRVDAPLGSARSLEDYRKALRELPEATVASQP